MEKAELKFPGAEKQSHVLFDAMTWCRRAFKKGAFAVNFPNDDIHQPFPSVPRAICHEFLDADADQPTFPLSADLLHGRISRSVEDGSRLFAQELQDLLYSGLVAIDAEADGEMVALWMRYTERGAVAATRP